MCKLRLKPAAQKDPPRSRTVPAFTTNKKIQKHISTLIPPATHRVPPATRWSREKELEAFRREQAPDRFQRRDVCYARRTARVCLQLCSFPYPLRHLCLSSVFLTGFKRTLLFHFRLRECKDTGGCSCSLPFFCPSPPTFSLFPSQHKVVQSLEFLLTFTLKEVLRVSIFFFSLFFTRDGGIPV